MARTTEQVFDDHMRALASGDAEALLSDYADDAVLLTLAQVCVGKAAIGGFFASTMEAFPNMVLTEQGRNVHGDTVLVTWSGDSDVATVEAGVDTFVIRDDKILAQTVWMTTPVPK